MKKSIFISIIILFAGYIVNAQTTNFGTGSGILGTNNSFFGGSAGNAANASSSLNSFLGYQSGALTTTGSYNDAFGSYSLYSNTSGTLSTAFGYSSLRSNTSGTNNQAFGNSALYSNTSGSYNLAVGYYSLNNNDTGSSNTAIGYESSEYVKQFYSNISDDNVAIGYSSLEAILSMSSSAIGSEAASSVTYSSNDVSVGALAGNEITNFADAQFRTSIGYSSGFVGHTNGGTFQNYVFIGSNMGQFSLFDYGIAVIGNSNTTSIGGQVGWSTLSDGRFKTDIRVDVSGIEFVKNLRPVSYTLDNESFDKFMGIKKEVGSQIHKINFSRQVGFIAQEVESIMKKSGITFSGLVSGDGDKGYYSLRYDDFVVPLVKSLQQLSVQKEAQEKLIDSLTNILTNLSRAKIDAFSNRFYAELNQHDVSSAFANTNIRMTIPPEAHRASIVVSNMIGESLKSIDIVERGSTSISIPAGIFTEGMYQYSLQIDGQTIDTRLLVLKN